MKTLTPADVDWSEGTPHSKQYGDVYHSRDGGMAQALAVFLGGNALPGRWRQRDHFCIAETGFGGGTNFLTTWSAWRDDPDRCTQLHYISAELHPWTPDDLRRLHREGPHANLAEQLVGQWPLPIEGFHALSFEGGAVRLLLLLGDALEQFRELDARIDAFYLDGFAPDRNPALWQPELIQRLGQLAQPEATAASYSVAAPVRDALSAAGFSVTRRPGFGCKRHALSAVRCASEAAARAPTVQSVAVVGAGVAGCAVATALARQRVDVTVFDSAAAPAAGASGNPLAMVRPWISRDDPTVTRLTRMAFLHTHRHHPQQVERAVTGLIHLPKTEADAVRFRVAAARAPASWARWVDVEQASAIAGLALTGGGLHYPLAYAIDPAALCQSWLSSPYIETRFHTTVSTLTALSGFDAIVIACAHASADLAPGFPLAMSRVRGQISLLPTDTLPQLRCTVSCDGYVIPMSDGAALLGATYDRDNTAEADIPRHRANLARLPRAFLQAPVVDATALDGRVGFRAVVRDRLPVAGIVPGDSGVWINTAYASRGVTWAALLGEHIAAQMLSRPSPLARPLSAAITPQRITRWTSPPFR